MLEVSIGPLRLLQINIHKSHHSQRTEDRLYVNQNCWTRNSASTQK